MYFFTQISRKHKIFLFSIFLILNILVYLFTERSLDSKIEYSKHDNLHELKVNYVIWEKNQATQADIIYDNLKKILKSSHYYQPLGILQAKKNEMRFETLYTNY